MKTFSALLAICAGNSPVPAEFPAQRPVTRSFDVFFDLRPNKRLSKQSWGWWFEPPSRPLWRHSIGIPTPVRVIVFVTLPFFWDRYEAHYSSYKGFLCRYVQRISMSMSVIAEVSQANWHARLHQYRHCFHMRNLISDLDYLLLFLDANTASSPVGGVMSTMLVTHDWKLEMWR